MPFSRMPKCSVRPNGPPFHIAVCLRLGMKEGWPSIVVLLDSARSAEPPHSSGMTSASAVEHLAGGGARRDALLVGGEGRQRLGEPGGHLPARMRSSRAARSGLALRHALKPLSHSRWAALPRLTTSRACLRTARLDDEGLLRVEAEQLLGGGDLLVAEGGAVRLAGVLLGRGRPRDDRVQHDEGRLVGDLVARADRREQGVDVLDVGRAVGVLAPVDVDDVPAVCLEAGCDVLAERDVGVVLDRDLVGVVDDGEVAELLVAGERARLVGDALLHVAVGGDDVDVVVERARRRGFASGSKRPR